MNIGFTGTREGMTWKQGLKVKDFIYDYLDSGDEFHHGDCVGADEEAHDIAWQHSAAIIIVHPPADSRLRAWCDGNIELPTKDYLPRNKDIVGACDYLLAAPHRGEPDGSGTWHTIRYAEKIGKPVTIVYADGTVERRNASST